MNRPMEVLFWGMTAMSLGLSACAGARAEASGTRASEDEFHHVSLGDLLSDPDIVQAVVLAGIDLSTVDVALVPSDQIGPLCNPQNRGDNLFHQIGGCEIDGKIYVDQTDAQGALLARHEYIHSLLDGNRYGWGELGESLVETQNGRVFIRNTETYNGGNTAVEKEIKQFNEWFTRLINYEIAAQAIPKDERTWSKEEWQQHVFDHGINPEVMPAGWRELVELALIDRGVLTETNIETTIQLAIAQVNKRENGEQTIEGGTDFMGPYTKELVKVDAPRLMTQLRQALEEIDPSVTNMTQTQFWDYLDALTTIECYSATLRIPRMQALSAEDFMRGYDDETQVIWDAAATSVLA